MDKEVFESGIVIVLVLGMILVIPEILEPEVEQVSLEKEIIPCCAEPPKNLYKPEQLIIEQNTSLKERDS